MAAHRNPPIPANKEPPARPAMLTPQPQRRIVPQPMLWGLGDVLRCRLTGTTGVAVSMTEYLYGCRRWGLQPAEVKDGKPVEWVHFDEPQLERVARALPATPAAVTGGPRPAPSTRPDPTR